MGLLKDGMLTRREMILAMAGWGGGVLALPGVVQGSGLPSDQDFLFSSEQRSVLAAAVERLLPGAVVAGVPEYIEFWLGQTPFRGAAGFLRQGARHLDAVAEKRFHQGFVKCAAAQQDTLLNAFAKGTVDLGSFSSRLFFQQLMELTLEGFLSDPKYGGNRNRVGWDHIGIPDGLASCWWNPSGVGRLVYPDKGFND